MTEPLLDIRDLSIAYRSPDGDTRAVRGVDLALHPGSIVGLAGESGCGKSTLAYGSVRLLRPPAVITGGSVTYHGRRIAGGPPEWTCHTGFASRSFGLWRSQASRNC